MDQINQLLTVIDRLLGDDGCPWDRKQTLATLKSDLLEETCEVIDAIHSKESSSIQEELGDLLFVTLFLCRLAEKEKVSNLNQIASKIIEKLIRRHPHVFHEKNELTPDGVMRQWEEIKKKEKGEKHPLERIPKALPALSRAHEIAALKKKHGWDQTKMEISDKELEIGQKLYSLAHVATELGIDPEMALRRVLALEEAHLKTLPSKK